MIRIGFKRSTIALILFLSLVLPGYAGQLDDYYLTAFGQQPGTAPDKATLLPVVEESAPHCGTPLKHGLSRDWKTLEPATRKVLAKQVAAPVLSGFPASLISSGGHFTIHYTTSGSDAPNFTAINSYTGLGLTSAADWAVKVGDAFEAAYLYYHNLGYQMPPTNPYDVYLTSLASANEYGETQSIQNVSSRFPYASSSFIQIDKDFTNSIFRNSNLQTYTPLQSLQITSAHEFHHAIQYGYTFYFDIWYGEATSTWFEDELYDSVDQNYSYITPWFQNSTSQLDLAVDSSAVSTGAGYGRWIFNRFLAENHTTTVVRDFFETLAGIAPTNGQDIPMTPVIDSVLSASYSSSLGADFFGLAKRVYSRDWKSHINEIGLIPAYSPVARYSSYPVNGNSTPAPSVSLPHYSFAYYTFIPVSGTTSLTITVTGTSGIQTALFKKSAGIVTEIAADASGSSYVVNAFGTGDEVALLVANSSGSDGEKASFSSDGTAPVNGTCGTSNGGTFTAIPATGLCGTGTAGTVTGAGPWSWSCAGNYGGTTARCSASVRVQYRVTPTAGSGFAISPATVQTIYSNETTAFTITPQPGFGIVSVSGCGGSLSGSTYTTGSVTANCTVGVAAVARNAASGTSGPTIGDALTALQAVTGTTQLTPAQLIRYDVAPLSANGVPLGNGIIDVADVILILRRSIGIGSW